MSAPRVVRPAEVTVPAAALPRRRFLGRALALLGGAGLLRRVTPAEAAVEESLPYLGEILLFAANFPPKGWTFCDGQLLQINQNQALFSLLGTTYGGNGTTNFALPDLRGRIPIHFGQGPGLTPRVQGSFGGEDNHTLTVAEIPAHTHTGRGASAVASAVLPSASLVPARNPGHVPKWGPTADVVMDASAIGGGGGSQPHANQQPFLVLRYIIAVTGSFPSP